VQSRQEKLKIHTRFLCFVPHSQLPVSFLVEKRRDIYQEEQEGQEGEKGEKQISLRNPRAGTLPALFHSHPPVMGISIARRARRALA
jgi:hypothetical protein